jgi:carboxy-cis,cis-muconate cyclase
MTLLVIAAAFSALAAAAKHHMFVGGYGTTSIYGVTHDDKSPTLLFQEFATPRAENERLALSYNGKTLYSAGRSGWSSFDVEAPGVISTAGSGNAPAAGGCGAQVARGVAVLAASKRPYNVYGSLACAERVGVGERGHVRAPATPIAYGADASVEIAGVAVGPAGRSLYSSDWRGGRIWTHAVGEDGALSLAAAVDAPSNVSRPLALAVHPSGRALYVVLSSWNSLAYYTVNQATRLPEYSNSVRNLVPAGTSFIFAPPASLFALLKYVVGMNTAGFFAQDVAVSKKGNFLWATVRCADRGKRGWLTGFRLDEGGRIVDPPLFQVETATGGGRANRVAASPFAENRFALAEAEDGALYVYAYANGSVGVVASGVIGARDKAGGGCCADVVWAE